MVSYVYEKEDWPWIWAIRNVINGKLGLNDDEIEQIQAKQQNLPVEIQPYLYLGSLLSATTKLDRIKELQITHILNVSGKSISPTIYHEYKKIGIQYKQIHGTPLDKEGYSMLENHLQESQSFIQQVIDANGRCLCFCEAGLNRSVLIVAAIVMLHEQISVLETIHLLRQCRNQYALNNESFQEQLVAYARQNYLLGPKPGTKECRLVSPTIISIPPPHPEEQDDDNVDDESRSLHCFYDD